MTNVQPYLNFDGRCEEALEFYTKALGAKVERLMRMKEAPPDGQSGFDKMPPGTGEKVMHSAFSVGGVTLMAADGYCQGKAEFKGFSLSITAPDQPTAHRWFDALAQGGKVEMPLAPTFFSPLFGMVRDKFGLSWMFVVHPA